MNPELVTQNVNPRAITTFFNAISSIEKFEEQLPLIQMIGEGSVGAEFSSMFTMFINNKMDKIISPQDIMTNTSEAYVVGALNGAVGTGDDFRADISSIITTRLINYSLKHASEHAVSDAMINRLVKLTTDCEAFTTDLKYYMVKEILAGNKPKFARLMQNANVIKMAVK
jgi:adenylosuccinate lyase